MIQTTIENEKHNGRRSETPVSNPSKSIEGHVRGGDFSAWWRTTPTASTLCARCTPCRKHWKTSTVLVLENHLNTCVTTAIRGEDADERERMIGEIVGVFQETGKL